MSVINLASNIFGGFMKQKGENEQMAMLRKRLEMEEKLNDRRIAKYDDDLTHAPEARALAQRQADIDAVRQYNYGLNRIADGGGAFAQPAAQIGGFLDLPGIDLSSLEAYQPTSIRTQQMQTDRQREKAGQQTELEKLKHNMRMEEILHRAKTNNAFKKSKAGTDVGKKASDLLGSAASSYQRMLSTVGDEGIALRQAARELFNRGSLTGYFKDGMTEYDYAVLIGGEDAAAQAFPDMAKGKQSQEVSSGTEAINKMQF